MCVASICFIHDKITSYSNLFPRKPRVVSEEAVKLTDSTEAITLLRPSFQATYGAIVALFQRYY